MVTVLGSFSLRITFVAAAMTIAFGPGRALADEDLPGPEALSAYDSAREAVWSRLDNPHFQKPWKDLKDLLSRDLPFPTDIWPGMEQFAQKGRHFSGDVSIDTETGNIVSSVRVDAEVIIDDAESLYFYHYLPVTGVTDIDGIAVPFEEDTYWGYPLIRIDLPEVASTGDVFSYVLSMEGVPDCTTSGPFKVNICGFGEVNYLAMDLFLPNSLAGDFATYEFEFTIQAGLVMAVNGVTVDVLPAGSPDLEVHHVVQEFPSEAFSMAMGPYEEAKIPYGEKWVGTFSMSADPLLQYIMPSVLTDMRDVLTFYSEKYGDFLFPKMEAVQIGDDAGAAFGWPALLWIPKGMFLMGGSGGGNNDSHQRTALFAHELGHQWFPDMNKSDDIYGRAWLSEGFAEFSSIYYMSSLHGEDYLNRVFDYYGVLYRYLVPWSADYGLVSEDVYNVSQGWTYLIVTYYKGSTVVNTIRQVIGKSAFLKAVKNLHVDHAGKDEYYDTVDLMQYFEDAFGEDLQWLFDQWVYGKGYPVYQVDVERHEDVDGDPIVRVVVSRGSSHSGVSFSMPVTIEVVTEEGEKEYVEFIDQEEMTFEYGLDSRLVKVRFDPERTFIKEVNPGLAGDMDLSGEVDGIDMLYASWAQQGSVGYSPNFLPFVDFDRDGIVDAEDLEQVTGNFGTTSVEVTK